MNPVVEQLIALPDDVAHEVAGLKRLSIAVGIPSHNNASTISKVAEEAIKGIRIYFPHENALIINADGGSTDGTTDLFKEIKNNEHITVISTPYRGVSGKGSAFKAFFEAALIGKARILITIDADNHSITRSWIRHLAYPIWSYGYGYVTPFYQRDKHDATISNSIAYPLTRSLYGQRIRQPIGGDFGMVRGLVQLLNRPDPWMVYPDIRKFGIDVWVTTTAINEGFKICQASLGTKVHEQKDPRRNLTPMFTQVIGTMFGLMNKYSACWRNIKHSSDVPLYGKRQYVEVEDIDVDVETLIDSFRKKASRYEALWEKIIEPEDLKDIVRLENKSENDLIVSPDMWARIVYSFAVAFNLSEEIEPKTVLESLIPLYHLRTASFMLETQYLNDELTDAHVEACSEVFERIKPYLLEQWTA